MSTDEEGKKALDRTKAKIKAAKNPRVDNDPAIRGDDSRKHGTWGDSKDTGHKGKHRRD